MSSGKFPISSKEIPKEKSFNEAGADELRKMFLGVIARMLSSRCFNEAGADELRKILAIPAFCLLGCQLQ